jgi:putative serine protease PepD
MIRANRFLPVLGGAIAGGAIALIVASGGGTTTHSTTTEVVASSRSAALPASFTGKGLSVNQIYRNASPGVVDITVSSQTGSPDPFGGGSQQTRGEGSGVVYDSSGNILTDEHVVANASSVTVKFQDGRTATAKVVGTDPSTDVAVLHVDVPSSELHPIPFADSSTAQVGDGVVAMGSPFGLPETTTTGIVSATGRSIQAPNQYTITGAIQTDAAINPGNSGGPLLNASGQVLGLNDQIQTQSGSSAGVGFAIPSNTVARVARQIISSGGSTVKHAYLGVQLKANGSGGAAIGSITPGAPADGAGLQPGDVITAVNGKATSTTDQFISTIDTYSPGDTVTLTVNHGGSTHGVKVKLGNRPSSPTSTLG